MQNPWQTRIRCSSHCCGVELVYESGVKDENAHVNELLDERKFGSALSSRKARTDTGMLIVVSIVTGRGTGCGRGQRAGVKKQEAIVLLVSQRCASSCGRTANYLESITSWVFSP
jgi:hypothetical protein